MAEVSEDELTPAPTTAESKAIRAIAKDSVHKICSGQVVLSLAVAVKELVENSIDARATLIEVKLKDQGLESLEVSDNGCGVKEENLEGMTAKYHTSKIREFDDLQGVETFGFRGEALSSLCALSDMVIVTRHSSTDVAVRLELDHEGQIKKRSPCAGTVGTTVTLTNLFATLPVRKREFKRNIKKEFTKMCQILQAYCLVSKGVRIICTNHTPKGGKSVLMKTNGVDDVLENISAIFGPRQTVDIIELKMPKLSNDGADVTGADESKTDDLNTEDGAAGELSKDEIEIATQFKLEGYVSSCSHGAGRSSRDRQYYYINSRPFDPKHVAKLVNEVYHRYNVNQYPFVYLNVLTKRSDVDVNLTPDKRQLLINHEKILLFFIKKALIHTYGHIPSTYKVQNKSISSMFKIENKDEADETQSVDGLLEEEEVPPTTQKRFMEVLSQWKRTGDTKGIAPALPVPKRKRSDEIETRTLKLRKIQEYLNRETSEVDKKACSYASEDDSDEEVKKTEKSVSEHQGSILDMDFIKTEANEFDDLINNESLKNNTSAILQRIVCKNATPKNSLHRQLHFIPSQDALLSTPPSSQSFTQPLSENMNEDEEALFTNSTTPQIILDEGEPENEVTIAAAPSCEISTSITEIELNLAAEENIRQEQSKMKLERLRFKSEISPSQNTNAEQELQREISKDMFAKMEILGQFNLGFIITKLDTDLFIVDQHATDEKYNFETLQQTVVLHHQPLAVPQLLDMTAVNEMVLLDHLAVFEKNGFKFDINHDAPATKKVRLLGKPCSKNWEFGKDDIDELIFMLQDAPEGAVCRPSRIRAMFASRACHKSVRIGQALKRSTMKQLVTHMGEIEQPWNCPHGRPTMRHLINIAMLHDIKEDIKVVIKEEI